MVGLGDVGSVNGDAEASERNARGRSVCNYDETRDISPFAGLDE